MHDQDTRATRRFVDRLVEICSECAHAAEVDGGAVSLITATHNDGPLCATDPTALMLEEVQFVVGEGPNFDATTSGSPVLVEDLADPTNGTSQHWPLFSCETAAMEVRSTFTFPLHLGAIALGTFTLYRATPGALDRDGFRFALLGSDTATATLLGLRQQGGAVGHGSELSSYLIAVHQAAGMLTVQLGVDIKEAFLRLRATAFAEERSINSLAADVIAGKRWYMPE